MLGKLLVANRGKIAIRAFRLGPKVLCCLTVEL
jgi:pyruvate carboxylase